MNRNLCKTVLESGGSLTPLLISSGDSKGLGLMNPSIYVDNDQLILNLRNVNYTLWHCEKEQIFNNRYGPLVYLNPENDLHLKTWNFFCVLNDDFTIKEYHKVDTSKLDIPPVWEFHGLEDARLFRWDNKLYMCGCRRDVKPDGESRMELSEIIVNKSFVKEKSRTRIEPPNYSYCEKNWMPILDMPYHFVKWTNPTEVVKVTGKQAETVFLSNKTISNLPHLRGSSQVLTYGQHRICLVHDCNLFHNRMGQKDATYTHRFVIWDLEWNITHISDPFSFMDGEIEFCCGMALWKNDLLISFGFQDNAAYILKIPASLIDTLLYE